MSSSGREIKTCPFCAENIKVDAKICKHCHSVLDDALQKQRAPRTWSPGVAAVLSLVIPGAGQMYRGKVGEGIAWLFIVVLGYMFFIVPGLILHLCCIISAASVPKMRKDPPWMQQWKGIGAVCIAIGFVVPVIARLDLGNAMPAWVTITSSLLIIAGVVLYVGVLSMRPKAAEAA